MKIFTCSNCGQLIYFENSKCESCGHKLGFDSQKLQLQTLDIAGNNFVVHGDGSRQFRYCANYQYAVCNWLVPIDSSSIFCSACELNRTIPNLNKKEQSDRWRAIEIAKHRMVFSLLRLNLPIFNKLQDEVKGIAFDFVADDNRTPERILTGHDNGLITINIAEADDIEREMARRDMAEMYRTLLGHFRHEIGHYYWDRLIADNNRFDEFRVAFGDETANYSDALVKHYNQGPPINWNFNYISSYASSHPWEDWAETWAHYMHIMDTLETAYAFGLSVHPSIVKNSAEHNTDITTDPYKVPDFNKILGMWLPLTFSMNSLNRSMGLKDPYPFIIPKKVIEKLSFIHGLCFSPQKTAA